MLDVEMHIGVLHGMELGYQEEVQSMRGQQATCDFGGSPFSPVVTRAEAADAFRRCGQWCQDDSGAASSGSSAAYAPSPGPDASGLAEVQRVYPTLWELGRGLGSLKPDLSFSQGARTIPRNEPHDGEAGARN